MAELLVLDGLRSGYGDSVVIDGISLSIAEGESLALLGRNGVGKTTLLLTLMGLTRHHGGSIRWQGTEIASMATFRRARSGLGWVPQERDMFVSLTVEEHLLAVARPGPWTIERAFRQFPLLERRRRNYGGQLSGGEQQLVALARALMTNPKLLLLDEPMEGLAPIIVQELERVIRDLVADGGMAVVLVEQHARLALGLTRNAIVLDRGQIVHASDSARLLGEPEKLDRLLAVA